MELRLLLIQSASWDSPLIEDQQGSVNANRTEATGNCTGVTTTIFIRVQLIVIGYCPAVVPACRTRNADALDFNILITYHVIVIVVVTGVAAVCFTIGI
jgi:hypothetical protein